MKRYLAAIGVFCALLVLPSQGLPQEAPEKSIWKAASDGDVEAIEAHIAAETDLDEQNETGYTPLHYGVMKTKPGVVTLLLEAGADPDVVNTQDPRHRWTSRFPEQRMKSSTCCSRPGRRWSLPRTAFMFSRGTTK